MHISFELWLVRLHSDADKRGMLKSIKNTSTYVLQHLYDDEVEPTINAILGYDTPPNQITLKSTALPASQVIQ